MAQVTYFVALPFVATDDGVAAGARGEMRAKTGGRTMLLQEMTWPEISNLSRDIPVVVPVARLDHEGPHGVRAHRPTTRRHRGEGRAPLRDLHERRDQAARERDCLGRQELGDAVTAPRLT